MAKYVNHPTAQAAICRAVGVPDPENVRRIVIDVISGEVTRVYVERYGDDEALERDLVPLLMAGTPIGGSVTCLHGHLPGNCMACAGIGEPIGGSVDPERAWSDEAKARGIANPCSCASGADPYDTPAHEWGTGPLCTNRGRDASESGGSTGPIHIGHEPGDGCTAWCPGA